MKKTIITFFAILFTCAAMSQSKSGTKYITIKGKVDFLCPADYHGQGNSPSMDLTRFNKVWIGHQDGNNFNVLDSVNVKPDGTWQLKVNATTPKFYDLDILHENRITVWADANMTINDRGWDTSFYKIKNPPYIFIEGSDDNNLINLVNHAAYSYMQLMIPYSQEESAASNCEDSTWFSFLVKQNTSQLYVDDLMKRLKVFIQIYQNRPVVLYAIKFLKWEQEKDFILPILSNLEKKYPNFKEISAYKKDILGKIAQANLLKPGMPVPNIAYNNPQGIPVSLASYKGKYLLIDFWASWCGPCRAATPKIEELYAKYKDKGFDVISISIDDKKQAWEKAMKEDNMPWAQVLSPDKNKTMETFLFNGIPTLFLVDDKGNIIKQFMGYSKELNSLLKGIFGY